jgi:hypothetical protein
MDNPYLQILPPISSATSILTPKHTEILSLIRQSEEARLEMALLNAHQQHQVLRPADTANLSSSSSSSSEEALRQQLPVAEREALEARARYVLRSSIITNALIAHPILRAVHVPPADDDDDTAAAAPPPLERTVLLDAVHARDLVAMAHSDAAARLAREEERARTAEGSVVRANQTNARLARRVVDAAEAVRDERTDDVLDPDLRTALERLDDDIARQRREWRVMKSLVAALVVASGADWPADPHLVELVLDDEDELK